MLLRGKWKNIMLIALVFLLGIGTGVAGIMLQGSNLLRGNDHSAPPVYTPPQAVLPQPPPSASTPTNPWNDPNGSFFGPDLFDSSDWDLFKEMQAMHKGMERLFNDSFGRFLSSPQFSHHSPSLQFSPDADLRDEGDHYRVIMDVPGADKGEVEVKVEGQTLMVSGKRDEKVEQTDPDGRVIRSERRSGSFQRSIALPGPVKAELVQASYDNGVLTITLPKADSTPQPKRIEIK